MVFIVKERAAMLSSKILKSAVVNADQRIVSVSALLMGVGKDVNSDEVFAALSAATNNTMRVIPGSVIRLDDVGIGQVAVAAALTPATRTLPASHRAHMTSVSSNIFMDDNERLWALRGDGNDRVLVMSASEDPDTLIEMMASCSSDHENELIIARDSYLRKAIDAHKNVIASVSGGDMVSYVDDGEVGVAFVAASTSGSEELHVFNVASQSASTINRGQVVAKVECDAIKYPDEVQLSESGVAAGGLKTIIDYYRRVFGHAPEYFKELEACIRQHSYA
jgi:hypothetical protein